MILSLHTVRQLPILTRDPLGNARWAEYLYRCPRLWGQVGFVSTVGDALGIELAYNAASDRLGTPLTIDSLRNSAG